MAAPKETLAGRFGDVPPRVRHRARRLPPATRVPWAGWRRLGLTQPTVLRRPNAAAAQSAALSWLAARQLMQEPRPDPVSAEIGAGVTGEGNDVYEHYIVLLYAKDVAERFGGL